MIFNLYLLLATVFISLLSTYFKKIKTFLHENRAFMIL